MNKGFNTNISAELQTQEWRMYEILNTTVIPASTTNYQVLVTFYSQQHNLKDVKARRGKPYRINWRNIKAYLHYVITPDVNKFAIITLGVKTAQEYFIFRYAVQF